MHSLKHPPIAQCNVNMITLSLTDCAMSSVSKIFFKCGCISNVVYAFMFIVCLYNMFLNSASLRLMLLVLSSFMNCCLNIRLTIFSWARWPDNLLYSCKQISAAWNFNVVYWKWALYVFGISVLSVISVRTCGIWYVAFGLVAVDVHTNQSILVE